MNQEQAIILYQPMLQAIAYNIVRCKADAEDIVQETFLKWLTLGPQKIENTKAYLVKAVKNNCLNHLTTLRKKKEELFSQHNFTEIIGRFKETSLAHLDFDVEMNKALKVLQTKLEPLERAVYLLKEVFDFDYESLQEALDKKKDHCRQLLCRAKKKLEDETSKLNFELPDPSTLVESFRKACHLGNASDLICELKKALPATSLRKS
ncbi:MAG TPA: sigma-70 family RNA polymerase sigma factor [Chryseolinea sp.]|jgi:RNA polymerase sigma-70 factor (ECF subfamily)|nr:sigma-70 family RNA polymerase sigma factor [Chryseolinea sp.]